MKNKFTELCDAIADTIKGRDNDIFTANDAAEDVKTKISELEKD